MGYIRILMYMCMGGLCLPSAFGQSTSLDQECNDSVFYLIDDVSNKISIKGVKVGGEFVGQINTFYANQKLMFNFRFKGAKLSGICRYNGKKTLAIAKFDNDVLIDTAYYYSSDGNKLIEFRDSAGVIIDQRKIYDKKGRLIGAYDFDINRNVYTDYVEYDKDGSIKEKIGSSYSFSNFTIFTKQKEVILYKANSIIRKFRENG